MTIALLFSAFLMGLLGSPHCLGMCGGILSAFGISMQGLHNTKKQQLIAIYHLGRLMSYMLLGAVAALLGATLFTAFHHSSLPRLLLGVALVLVALLMFGVPLLNRIERLGFGFWRMLSPLRAKLFPLNTAPKALSAGLLWGFLPCGLVYGAMLLAVSSSAVNDNLMGQLSVGALMMLSFGLGTLPMLVATGQVIAWLQHHIKRFNMRQVSATFMLLSGLAIAVPPLLHSHTGHALHNTNDMAHANHNLNANHSNNPNSHAHHTANNPNDNLASNDNQHNHSQPSHNQHNHSQHSHHH